MRFARAKVSLVDLGIQELKIRRAITGAMALEIAGENNASKANRLVEELRAVFHDRPSVRIVRPIKMAELRVRDLEILVTPEEIAVAIATAGSCQIDDVKVGNRSGIPNGLWLTWVKCPLTTANILSRVGTLRIGWSRLKSNFC